MNFDKNFHTRKASHIWCGSCKIVRNALYRNGHHIILHNTVCIPESGLRECLCYAELDTENGVIEILVEVFVTRNEAFTEAAPCLITEDSRALTSENNFVNIRIIREISRHEISMARFILLVEREFSNSPSRRSCPSQLLRKSMVGKIIANDSLVVCCSDRSQPVVCILLRSLTISVN